MKYIAYTLLAKVNTEQITNDDRVLKAAENIILGKHIDFPDTNIKAALGIVSYDRKVFDNRKPIENRRAAFEYAQNYATSVNESRQYISPKDYAQAVVYKGQGAIHQLFDNIIPLFNAWINVEINGKEKTIGGIVEAQIEMIKAWVEEYEHYKINGYAIGGEKPFKTYFMPFDKEIAMLPDIEPLWKTINTSNN